MDKKRRIIGLDILRITCVFIIFLFHAAIHLDCSFSFLTPFIKMGPVFMCVFFMLSGFSLYYVYSSKTIFDISELLLFYKKRAISILPLYYIVAIVYLVIFKGGGQSFFQNIILLPTEILGIQSFFDSLFSVSHNSGTWFISCIVICYLVYPLIQIIAQKIKVKSRIIIILVLGFVLLYAPFLVGYYKLSSIYSNPFFRILEFAIGVFLCTIIPEIKKLKISRVVFSIWMVIFSFILLIVIETVLYNKGFFVGNYMLYSGVMLPVLMLLLVACAGCEFPKIIYESKVILYLSSISYAFWMAQFFAYKATSFVLNILGYSGNVVKLLVSFCICVLLGIVLHELIEKPIAKFFLRRKKVNEDG